MVLTWLKKHKNLVQALLMMLLPLICCIVTCALEGQSIGKVYLPASEWNDELFYYKQVEGIVNYGFPHGYFGFNESHALKLSFAAWSPILVWPWILWGLIFGWNLHSPIYCNIVLMMLTMFGFVKLVKPSWKQLGMLTVLYVSFTPFTRYMLSGMPEIICFDMVLMTFALGVSYFQKEHTAKLVLLFVMTALMTLMRPYLIMFMLLPVGILIWKKKWKGFFASAGIGAVTGVCYLAINHYLGAEYFTPLFDTTWISKFLHEGIGAGFGYMFSRLWSVGARFMWMLGKGFQNGLATGARFAAFLLTMLILLVQAVRNYRKKEYAQFALHLYLGVCSFGMWMALLLMYKMEEGSKHLLTFIAVDLFAIALMETKFYRKMILTAAVFTYLFGVMAVDPRDYQIPFQTEQQLQLAAEWETVFDSQLRLAGEPVPNFENVVIWEFADEVDGEQVMLSWQYLYALPEGFGISCCMSDFLSENLDSLQSKYLAVVPGGTVQTLCVERGLRLVGNSNGMAVYERY